MYSRYLEYGVRLISHQYANILFAAHRQSAGLLAYVKIGTAYHQLLRAEYNMIAQQIGDHRYKVNANKAAHLCEKLADCCSDMVYVGNKIT